MKKPIISICTFISLTIPLLCGFPEESQISYNSSSNVYTIGNSTQKKQKFYWDSKQELIFINLPENAVIKKINKNGQIAGNYKTPENQNHGFFWDKDYGFIDLGTLGGKNSWVNDMNDYGEIVGYSEISEPKNYPNGQSYIYGHGFLWQYGIMLDLHEFPLIDSHTKVDYMKSAYKFSNATGINNNRTIIGYGKALALDQNGLMSLIWEDNKIDFLFKKLAPSESGTIPIKIAENNNILIAKTTSTSRLKIYLLDRQSMTEIFLTEISNKPEEWFFIDLPSK